MGNYLVRFLGGDRGVSPVTYPILQLSSGFIERRDAGIISMKSKDITPLIMWFILFVGIIVIAFIRHNRFFRVYHEYTANLDIIFIGLYLLWMLIEFRVTKEDVKTEGKKTSDFMTCQLYGFGQALTFLTALWFSSVKRVPNISHFIGLSIFLFGGLYRLWAVRTLGRYYSHRVRTVSKHQIVASGPYRLTRHPAYAGMIIANAGISTYFFNWVTICVFLSILLPAILFRIIIEEKVLFEIEGYSEFAKKRKRLFPAVW